jgi:hypothetical protein
VHLERVTGRARLQPPGWPRIRPSRVGQVQVQERQLTVCLSPDAYTYASMYARLTERGVQPQAARWVASLVSRRAAEKRLRNADHLQIVRHREQPRDSSAEGS